MVVAIVSFRDEAIISSEAVIAESVDVGDNLAVVSVVARDIDIDGDDGVVVIIDVVAVPVSVVVVVVRDAATEDVDVNIVGSDNDSDKANGDNCCLIAVVAIVVVVVETVAVAAVAAVIEVDDGEAVMIRSDSCHGLPGDSFPEFDDEMEEFELCEIFAKL